MKIEDKRTISNEGFLTADAVLTKVGDLRYTKGELGIRDGNPDDIITLRRSREVLEESLPSMRGAFVTVGHPGTFIGVDDAKYHVVGSVITEPEIDSAGYVRAKVRIFDRDAINKIKSGTDQLSPGFNFVPSNLNDTSGDITKMSINHVAIVPRGRAGETVRLLDHLPDNLVNDNEVMNMKENEISDIIQKAVDASLQMTGGAAITKDQVVKIVTDAVNPIIESVQKIQDAQTKAATDEAKKQAEDSAQKEREKLIDEVVSQERQRYKVINDALPYIAEDQRDGILDKTAKEVLVMAVGDDIPNANDLPEATLAGVLMGKGLVRTNDTGANVTQGVVDKSTTTKSTVNDLYKSKFRSARGKNDDKGSA